MKTTPNLIASVWTIVLLATPICQNTYALDEKTKIKVEGVSPPAEASSENVPSGISAVSSGTSEAAPVRRTVKDYLNFRDPFLRIPLDSLTSVDKPFLERYPLASFRLRGVLSGPLKKRAMLETPDGKVHFVAEANKIGMRDGKVERITTRSVIVREKIVNPVGALEEVETEIVLDEPK